MKDHRWIVLFSILFSIPIFMALSIFPMQGLPEGDAVVGGKLYDNWFHLVEKELPTESQPLWALQDESSREGEFTWRCSTCHGWDYKGAEGAYAHGPEYTGFPGITSVIGQSNEEIREWLDGTQNPEHDFSPYFSEKSEDDMIAFLRTRLIETALIIDYETRESLGSVPRGINLYDETCESCHGVEGENLNLGSANSPAYLGDVAVRSPWQFVHKTRFGHPASNMPATDELGWSLQHVADVLAFAQGLPLAKPLTEQEQNPNVPLQVDLSGQGDTTGITIGAIVLVTIIFGGVAMVLLRDHLLEIE